MKGTQAQEKNDMLVQCGINNNALLEIFRRGSCVFWDEKEEKRRPIVDYMQKIQKDVSVNMSGILVDWLVELAEEFKVVSDTLYLTISHIDRYLSSKPINQQRLQLLGVAAMLIVLYVIRSGCLVVLRSCGDGLRRCSRC